MISSGASTRTRRAGARSRSSTVRTTRTCWYPGPQADRQGDLDRALQTHPRIRGAARRKRHGDPQILPPYQQGGAARPLRPTPRRPGPQLEDQRVRLFRAGPVGRLHRGVRGRDQRDQHKEAPWYVIPSNHKWFRNLAVSQIMADTMEELKLEFPPPRSTSTTSGGSITPRQGEKKGKEEAVIRPTAPFP